MKSSNGSTNSFITAVRWTARISSIIITIVFLLMFFGEGFEPEKVTPREWISLLFFPFGLILGMILAWWKEGLGGAITIGSLVAELFVGDVSGSGGGPMLICASPGFLFLLSWFLSKTAGMPTEESQTSALDSYPSVTEKLETKKARIEAGLCPKCGAPLAATDKNCPSCRINLAFALEHLEQW